MPGHPTEHHVPSFIRFLIWIGAIAGIGYGAMLALVTFVEPQQREMTAAVPPSKFAK